MAVSTGRIGSRQQLAGGMSWGCSGGAQQSCGNYLHPMQLRFHGKTLFRKKWPIFPASCGGLVPCGPSALLATQKAPFVFCVERVEFFFAVCVERQVPLFFCFENSRIGGVLRWLLSPVCSTSSSDETETRQHLFLSAYRASGQLGLRGYVLWLVQARVCLRPPLPNKSGL